MSGYTDGLLDAQRMANEASNKAMQAGKTEAANALAELSTDLLMVRQAHEAAEARGVKR